MSPKPRPIEDRFWKYVNKTNGCWNWTGAHLKKGYGRISLGPKDKIESAHRVSWMIHFGNIPDGLWVLHKCDNPSCVRPDHLFLGNHLDNDADRDQKGRTARGERTYAKNPQTGDKHWSHRIPEKVKRGENHPKAKLSQKQVNLIREKRAQGITSKILAKKFGVSPRTIRKIVQGTRWAKVK